MRFYEGVYLEAFAAQREPLASWQAALAGETPYGFDVRLALDGDDIIGGITQEYYPRSRCGFITYLVVAAQARGKGLGRQLFDHGATALYKLGARAVFGEARDVSRFLRWGGRVVDAPYVQPSLGEGLSRDTSLQLFVHPPLPASLEGDTVREFVTELYAATEGVPPDPTLLDGIPKRLW